MNTDRPAAHVDDLARIRHNEAMELTATENRRLLTQLHGLSPRDWGAATDCTGWTVRDVVVHLIASAQAQASPQELTRQVRAGWLDGLNEAQLRARTDLIPDELPLAVAAHLRRGAHRAAAYAREQLGEGSVFAVSDDRGRRTASRPARARGSHPCW